MKYSSAARAEFARASVPTAFDWKGASKASICAFMLAFAPLSVALAQGSSNDDAYVAPAAPVEPAAPAAAAAPAQTAAVSSSAATSNSSSAATQLSEVSVVGSAFAGPSEASALPITTYSAEQLKQQGITSAQQALNQLPTNNTDAGLGLGTGAQETGGAVEADLRGLGPQFTLVLLNGRRLADDPLYGGAVSVNTIPFGAIKEIQVLRDGASALYGTDAIGGVINFITKQNLQGGDISVQEKVPTRDGGGDTSNVEFTIGHGDLNKDRYNIMLTGQFRQVQPISANARPGVIQIYNPAKGISQVSSFDYPANYFQGNSAYFNPANANGCSDPLNVDVGGSDCKFNYTHYSQIQQRTDQASALLQGAYKINDNNKLSLEYLFTRQDFYTQGAPGLTAAAPELDPLSPYYPGNGVTPANPAIDPTQPINILYRNVPLGPRREEDITQSHSVVLELKGHASTGLFKGIHYDTALNYDQSGLSQDYTSGYFSNEILDDAFNNGTINPFSVGPLSPAGKRAEADAALNGNLQNSKTRVYDWDGSAKREVGNWFGAGESLLALGAQYRHEQWTQRINNNLADATQASGGAFSNADPVNAYRDIESAWGDLHIPLLSTNIRGLEDLSIDAQARYSYYSDFGGTVDPKVSLRYQPVKPLLLRASYGEGFSAPTLYQENVPQALTYTDVLNDPKYCPNGKAVPGAPGGVCNQQFLNQYGGNKNLQPQTSRNWTAGIVVSPLKNLSVNVDFWWIEIANEVGSLSAGYILEHPNEYASFIRRDPTTGVINNIYTPYLNLAKVETHGIDFGVHYHYDLAKYGSFGLSYEGTYTSKYDDQAFPGGSYSHEAGVFDGAVIPRYKHTATLNWAKGPVSAQVTNNFTSGYTDESPKKNARVNPFITWDMSAAYTWKNGIEFRVGSDNIFDQDPPFSNQNIYGQGGYDSLYSDAIGRTVFGRLTYSF